MNIELITPELHAKIKSIFENYPELTLQNQGYEYLNKSEFTPKALIAFGEVSDILRKHVEGFSKFFNFKVSKDGQIQLRFDYAYSDSFTGVGYILLDELLNGF